MEENLQNEESQDNFAEGATCLGVAKPANPPGKVGDWACTSNGWEWTDFIGLES